MFSLEVIERLNRVADEELKRRDQAAEDAKQQQPFDWERAKMMDEILRHHP